MKLVELQLDRIVGPTHHFGGLGVGNLASQQSAGMRSNPAAAAMQGLQKMRLVSEWTDLQLVLPPQPRPDLGLLRNLGFVGGDHDVLKRAREEAPELLSAATSCSAMWTANAATACPAVDSLDPANQHTTLTVANLNSSIHRVTEATQTDLDLRQALPQSCVISPPLQGGTAMRDEGAANHMRLGTIDARAGIHLFVYGDRDPRPLKHWPRQSRAACEAMARRHRLPPENAFFLKQHPEAIDAGAFHNDVVAMSHHGVLIHHELAFLDADETLANIAHRYRQLNDRDLIRIEVANDVLNLADTVDTYLFNSQIVSTHSDAAPRIVCTRQVQQHPVASGLIAQWCDRGIFASVQYVDLDQSMSGGGGPACLRLRVPIPENQLDTIPQGVRFTESTFTRLSQLIVRDYPSSLSIDDLARVDFHQHAAAVQANLKRLLT